MSVCVYLCMASIYLFVGTLRLNGFFLLLCSDMGLWPLSVYSCFVAAFCQCILALWPLSVSVFWLCGLFLKVYSGFMASFCQCILALWPLSVSVFWIYDLC